MQNGSLTASFNSEPPLSPAPTSAPLLSMATTPNHIPEFAPPAAVPEQVIATAPVSVPMVSMPAAQPPVHESGPVDGDWQNLQAPETHDEEPGAEEEQGKIPSLERLLLKFGLLSPTQLTDAMREEHATGRPLWQIVLERGWVSREDLMRLAEQTNRQETAAAEPEPAPAVEVETEAAAFVEPQPEPAPVSIPVMNPVTEQIVELEREPLFAPMAAPVVEPAPEPQPIVAAMPAPAVTAAPAPEPQQQPIVAAMPAAMVAAAPEPEPQPQPPASPIPVFKQSVVPDPEPEPEPEPAPAPATIAPVFQPVPEVETLTIFRVVMRLANGERIETHSCNGAQAARSFAQDLVRGLASEPDTWPYFSGRFVRPASIISVDVEAAL